MGRDTKSVNLIQCGGLTVFFASQACSVSEPFDNLIYLGWYISNLGGKLFFTKLGYALEELAHLHCAFFDIV